MHSIKLSGYLRAAAGNQVAKAPKGVEIIDRALLVGALRDPADPKQLGLNDYTYMGDIQRQLPEAGAVLSPDAELLLCTGPRQDFTAVTAPVAPLVVFCRLCFDPARRHRRRVLDPLACWQSPCAQDPAAWRGALERSGARWAFNVHRDEIELPTDFLAAAPFALKGRYRAGENRYDLLIRQPA
ncbi:MAG: hypothetical protein H6865_06915 [Rhodospirillales bacterium]|nr:hypothetical protein [Alphaproteobacteria bacterium]MCB9987347.1 hypothetical protein [Rhodospirillales bacterium]USO07803.1 MAG: hypothetical protein H6866_00790 [Rhodospirillales bacterium]